MTSLARQLRTVAAGGRSLGGRAVGGCQWRPWWLTASRGRRPSVAAEADRLARVEAVLFLAKEALSLRRLAQLAAVADATEARTLVEQLAARYVRNGRAYQVANVAGGYRLLTRPEFAAWIGKLGDLCDLSPASLKLTPPALDTLTVVAYRQPVLRSEVEAIRGVGCGELLRQLIERDLLRIVGRSEELGRPLQYGTTKRFLQVFGLKSLEDLPPIDGQCASPQTQLAANDSRPQNVVPPAA